MSYQLCAGVQKPKLRYLPASEERRKTISLVYFIVMNYRRLCGVKIHRIVFHIYTISTRIQFAHEPALPLLWFRNLLENAIMR